MINLHDMIDALRAGRVWEPTFKKTIRSAFPKQHDWILRTAKQAVCFDVGDVEHVPALKIITELFRMPYKVTWFEAENRDGLLGMLVAEVGPSQLHIAVMNKRLRLAWQLVNVVEVYVDESNELRCCPVLEVYEDQTDNDEALNYSSHACNLMCRFVMAINCTNTQSVEHPAPKFLNAKRAAKGKQPLFSYWTLHLPGSTTESEPLGGTHASPRIHLRRGHIRQYTPGKFTWIEACVVGKKQNGIVLKDYAVDPNH